MSLSKYRITTASGRYWRPRFCQVTISSACPKPETPRLTTSEQACGRGFSNPGIRIRGAEAPPTLRGIEKVLEHRADDLVVLDAEAEGERVAQELDAARARRALEAVLARPAHARRSWW